MAKRSETSLMELLGENEFGELDELLLSHDLPETCMNVVTLQGFLTQPDCLRAVLGTVYSEGSASLGLVCDHMTPAVISCAPDQDIIEVAQSMLEHHHRRRPVTKNGKLVDQLSCRNILWAIMEYTGPQS